MFSELHHYPPAAFSLKPNHLPIGVGNDRSTVTEFLEVSGMARCKYFSRPVMPYKNVLSGQVIYAKQPEVEVTNKEVVDIDKVKETRTIGIQSTYRISETQTDPYSPAYIYDSALPVPELVGLSSLVYGKGLPAGKAEVEMIERARIKKEWEANLPPATDPKSYEKRLEMMEEMEMREWKDRDLEIKRVQEERLKVLETVIRQREQKNSVENEKREDRALQKKMQEKDFFMDKINQKRIKGIRKLQEARAKVDKRSLKRDIISDYVNYTSRVYSPKARDGLRKANAETTVKVKLEELSDYKGLENFQSKLDMSFMEASPGLPLQDTTSITYRKQQFLKNQLDIMSAKVNLTKERQAKSTALTPKVVLKTEVVVKSPIEQFQAVQYQFIYYSDNNDEELEGAAIKLQSLIRGRAVQEQMFAGMPITKS